MNKDNIMGGILAGGLSRRMGGTDKVLVQLNNQTLLSRSVNRLSKQVGSLVINANGDPDQYDNLGHPVIGDIIQGFAGPLAGIHALMTFAKNQDCGITHIATVAADTPFFPVDFVDQCVGMVHDEKHFEHTIVLAKSGTNRHPVFGLWPVHLSNDLETFLNAAETRKVMAFVQNHSLQYAEFPIREMNGITIDPFFNINRPDDLIEAVQILEYLEPVE